jgi:hypothetical protein
MQFGVCCAVLAAARCAVPVCVDACVLLLCCCQPSAQLEAKKQPRCRRREAAAKLLPPHTALQETGLNGRGSWNSVTGSVLGSGAVCCNWLQPCSGCFAHGSARCCLLPRGKGCRRQRQDVQLMGRVAYRPIVTTLVCARLMQQVPTECGPALLLRSSCLPVCPAPATADCPAGRAPD